MKFCKPLRVFSARLIGYFFSLVFSLFVSLGLAVSPAYAQITGSGDIDNYTYSGGFTARQYSVYVPPSYDGTSAVPMIFALHGCAMDHIDAMNLWNLDVIADQHNVIVVFPFVTSFGDFSQRNENCWGYWLANHVQEGDGNDGEVDDLYAIAQEVESRYQIDSERRFITGLSGGGAMAIAEAVAYNDYWTAAAPVAGLAYGDGSTSVLSEIFNSVDFHVGKINTELNFNKPIPMLVVQSSNDTVVRPRAMELIRDSQLTVWGGDLNADSAEDCTRDGVNCTLTTYNDADGLPLVKTLVYSGLPGRSATYGQGHYWTGGDENQNVWSKSSGPSASEHMWEFFSEVSGGVIVDPVCEFDDTPPAPPTGLSSVDPHDTYVVLSVSANTEEDLRGYKVYRTSGLELTPSPISSTTLTVVGLSAQTQYDVYATAVDNCGNESSASGSVSFTTTSLEYVAPSASGTATEHYLAGRLDVNEYIAMGGQYGYIASFTLWQQQSGTWTDANPNGSGGDDNGDGNGNNNGEPGSWTTSPSLSGMEVHVYSPNSSTSNGMRALMISLHGCSQSNEQVRDSWGWTDEADQYGMVIAAPMAPNGGVLIGCWDYYGSNHSASNPGRHDDNLIDLANSLMANTSLNIDPDQVYISGLSSGGGQTFVMGCLSPEIFAGIGINAGPALGTSSSQIGSVPFGTSASSVANICTGFSNSDGDFNTQLTSVVHGNSDTLVGTAYAALDSEAMARVYGANKDAGTNVISGGGTEETWSDNDGVRVSKIMVSGLPHAWPAGSGSSGGGQYTNHSTIDYPAFLTKFLFDNNRRANFSGPHPTPVPTPVSTPVQTPTPTGTPVPTVTPTPVPSPTIMPSPSPTPTATPAPSCSEVSAYNYYHKVGGRATSSGAYFSPNYVANGSNDAMAGSTWGLTRLYSFDGTYWRVGSCP